ncbi:MAG: hypothetical protein IJE40_03090 [Clostridia bacterium]|nr:hypothetical protein [Clostridia bacterium]
MRKLLLILSGILVLLSSCTAPEITDKDITDDVAEDSVLSDVDNKEYPEITDSEDDAENSDSNNENIVSDEVEVDYLIPSDKKINVDSGRLTDIRDVVCFYEDYLIYTKVENRSTADGGSVPMDLYKYNIDTRESIYLGTNQASYSSGDSVVVNDKMYIYEGGVVYDSALSEWVTTVSLLQIGLVDESLIVVETEYLDSSVIQFEVCGDYIISKKISDDGIVYIDRRDLKVVSSEFERIIMSEADAESEKFVGISAFSVYNKEIYVLCRSISLQDEVSYYINVYNVDGSFQRRITIASEINKMISETSVSNFKVFGDYILIAPWRETGYLLNINSDNAKVVLADYALNASVSSKPEDDIYLFSAVSGKVWAFDDATNTILELNGVFENITYLRVCDDDILVNSGGEIYYFSDGSFIVED